MSAQQVTSTLTRFCDLSSDYGNMSNLSDSDFDSSIVSFLLNDESDESSKWPSPSSTTESYDTHPIMIKPELKIIMQPKKLCRYRYLSETNNNAHGPLQGMGGKKTFPTVQLLNYNEPAKIRCWFVRTNTREPEPHYHKLLSKVPRSKTILNEPHDLDITPHSPVASFKSLVIITAKSSARNDDEDLLYYHNKLNKFEGTNIPFDSERKEQLIARRKKPRREKSGRLFFQALNSKNQVIASTLSHPIGDSACKDTNDLKIIRSNCSSGSYCGGSEMWLLVEKITSDIDIVFEDSYGWQDKAIIILLHHQSTLIISTPPYRDRDLDTETTVHYYITRKSDGNMSNSLEFTYLPSYDFGIGKKRKYSECSSRQSYSPNSITGVGMYDIIDDYSSDPLLSSTVDAVKLISEMISPEFNSSDLPSLKDLPETDGFLCLEDEVPEDNHTIESVDSYHCLVGDWHSLQLLRPLDQTKLNKLNHEGETALQRAITLGFVKTAVQLIQDGIDINAKNPKSGQTALHLAVHLNCYVYVISSLIEHGADVNAQDWAEFTPLHLAVVNNNILVVKMLLVNNANPSLKNFKGQTPYSFARSKEMKTLLEPFMEIDSDDEVTDLLTSQLIDELSNCLNKGEQYVQLAQITGYDRAFQGLKNPSKVLLNAVANDLMEKEDPITELDKLITIFEELRIEQGVKLLTERRKAFENRSNT